MITLNPNGTVKPWSDAERVAHIREQAAMAETRGGKLHRGDVEEIRELYVEGEMTVSQIARQFGVTRNVVTNVALGHSWGYPPLPARKPQPDRKAA